MKPCPCQSNLDFEECCDPLLSGRSFAETPEQLMRSRYTAFCEGDVSYILNTMTGPALEQFSTDDLTSSLANCEWTDLQVLDSTPVNEDDDEAYVEFKATYEAEGKPHVLHERSKFFLQNGQWFYYSGQLLN